MKKHVIKLTNENEKEINKIRLKSNNSKERQKAGAIYFQNRNYELSKISRIVGITVQTIIKHTKGFIGEGMEYILKNNYKGHASKLEDYSDKIIDDFKNTPPATISEATYRIENLTGLKRSGTQVRNFLKKKVFLTKNQEAYLQKQIEKNKKNS